MEKSISELRQDMVTGDWVLIATGRGKRPNEFSKQKKISFLQPKVSCPFEEILPNLLLAYGKDGTSAQESWWVQVVPNKFPAFGHGVCMVTHAEGPYRWGGGMGFHEVIITRDHIRHFAEMSGEEIALVLRAYQERFLALAREKCIEYIAIFHNHGRESGATISHPHSQLIAMPVIPPDISRSLGGSADFYRRNKKCVHCSMLSFDLKNKERIVYENREFVILAPFASRAAFEIRIFPKSHNPHFESINTETCLLAADALRAALRKLSKGLKNPDYNFFIHTAPAQKGKDFSYYHWHIEIVPKTAIWAGFEIGTGIEISTIAPESAAKFLRNIRI